MNLRSGSNELDSSLVRPRLKEELLSEQCGRKFLPAGTTHPRIHGILENPFKLELVQRMRAGNHLGFPLVTTRPAGTEIPALPSSSRRAFMPVPSLTPGINS